MHATHPILPTRAKKVPAKWPKRLCVEVAELVHALAHPGAVLEEVAQFERQLPGRRAAQGLTDPRLAKPPRRG